MRKEPYLETSVKNGKIKIVEKLIKKGIDMREHDFILVDAIKGGHVAIFKLLLENGAIINNRTMYYAAKKGNMEIVKLLMEKSGQKWRYDLKDAAEGGNMDIVKLFIKNGATNYKNGFIGAAGSGSVDILNFMLKKDPGIAKDGRSVRGAFIEASTFGHMNILKILSLSKFNKSEVNYSDFFERAAAWGHVNIVARFASHSKNWDNSLINASQGRDETGYPSVVKYLLKRGKFITNEGIIKAYNITKNSEIKRLLRADKRVKGIVLKMRKTSYVCTIKLVFNATEYGDGDVGYCKNTRASTPTNAELRTHMESKGRLKEFVTDIVGYTQFYKDIRDISIDDQLNIRFTVTVDPTTSSRGIPGSAAEVKDEIDFSNQSFADGCYEGNSSNECHYPDANNEECSLGELRYTVIDVVPT